MCKVPMIAAILCSICKHKSDLHEQLKDENCALFVIFRNFTAMLIAKARENRPYLFNQRKVEQVTPRSESCSVRQLEEEISGSQSDIILYEDENTLSKRNKPTEMFGMKRLKTSDNPPETMQAAEDHSLNTAGYFALITVKNQMHHPLITLVS